MEIVSDRTLSRDCKRQLLELGLREAQMFKRQTLMELINQELQNPPFLLAASSSSSSSSSISSSSTQNSSSPFLVNNIRPPFIRQNGYGGSGSNF
ncbi:unnamed protein product [Meloidogyne enterolobii]|uniref:Uncharacterized protein n=1 Tax=Meloidogyne enterolobii TaxID=390850 RepID=A0ACB1A854_MELEN